MDKKNNLRDILEIICGMVFELIPKEINNSNIGKFGKVKKRDSIEKINIIPDEVNLWFEIEINTKELEGGDLNDIQKELNDCRVKFSCRDCKFIDNPDKKRKEIVNCVIKHKLKKYINEQNKLQDNLWEIRKKIANNDEATNSYIFKMIKKASHFHGNNIRRSMKLGELLDKSKFESLMNAERIDIYTILLPVRGPLQTTQIYYMYNLMKSLNDYFSQDGKEFEEQEVYFHYIIPTKFLEQANNKRMIPIKEHFRHIHSEWSDETTLPDFVKDRIFVDCILFADIMINEAIKLLLNIDGGSKFLNLKRKFEIIYPIKTRQNFSIRHSIAKVDGDEKNKILTTLDEKQKKGSLWFFYRDDVFDIFEILWADHQLLTSENNIFCLALIDSVGNIIEPAIKEIANEVIKKSEDCKRFKKLKCITLNPGTLPIEYFLMPLCYFGHFSWQKSLIPIKGPIFKDKIFKNLRLTHIEGAEEWSDPTAAFFKQILIIKAFIDELDMKDRVKKDVSQRFDIDVTDDFDDLWDMPFTSIYLFFEWTQLELTRYLTEWVKR